MTFEGQVQDGVIVLNHGARLPDGTQVEVVVRDEPNQAPTLKQRLQKLSGIVDDLPADMARNHDHYVHGAKKR